MEIKKLPKYWYTDYTTEILENLKERYNLDEVTIDLLTHPNYKFIGFVGSSINKGLFACGQKSVINGIIRRYPDVPYISNQDYWKCFDINFNNFKTVYSLALDAKKSNSDVSKYIKLNIKKIYE